MRQELDRLRQCQSEQGDRMQRILEQKDDSEEYSNIDVQNKSARQAKQEWKQEMSQLASRVSMLEEEDGGSSLASRETSQLAMRLEKLESEVKQEQR